jgi:hypothetical protein
LQNAAGQWVWCFLKEGSTIEEIIRRLHEEFDVEPEQAREGVVNLLEELLSFKLINDN